MIRMKDSKELDYAEIKKAFINGKLSNEEIHYICTKLCHMGILRKDNKIECTHICCPYDFWNVADLN